MNHSIACFQQQWPPTLIMVDRLNLACVVHGYVPTASSVQNEFYILQARIHSSGLIDPFPSLKVNQMALRVTKVVARVYKKYIRERQWVANRASKLILLIEAIDQ